MSVQYRRLSLKLHPEHDRDLYLWSYAVPMGISGQHLKAALREYLQQHAGQTIELPPPPPPPPRSVVVPPIPTGPLETMVDSAETVRSEPERQTDPSSTGPGPEDQGPDDDTLDDISDLANQF